MKITLLTVGKIKEKFYRDAIAEYSKRLSRYCNLTIIEVSDEKTPDKSNEALDRQIRQKEGARLLDKLNPEAYTIVLAIDGKNIDSISLSKRMEQLALSGNSHLQFIIGGSLGLDEAVLEKADFKLSFGAMTFPHQLMRVILLEQIYRGFRISNNEPYHK